MKLIFISLIVSFNYFHSFGQRLQVEANCSDQLMSSFTSAMDSGADAIHLHVLSDNNKFTLTSGLILIDVIKAAERHTKSYTRYEIKYIINLQKSPNYINEARALYILLDSYIPMERITIRSSDFKILKYWNKTHPEIKLAAVSNDAKSIDTNLANLGFKPNYYCRSHNLLNEKEIENLHKRSILVSSSFTNDTTSMRNMYEWKVDRIVTDSLHLSLDLGYNRDVKDGSN
jgi:glycerophosphoryl diester phosphodiesterase